MLKVMSLMKRRDDMTLDEFRHWAQVDHPLLGKKLPGMRSYRMSVVIEENPDWPFDAVSEFFFDDKDTMAAAFATPAGKAAGEDAAAHCSRRVRLLTEEHIILP